MGEGLQIVKTSLKLVSINLQILTQVQSKSENLVGLINNRKKGDPDRSLSSGWIRIRQTIRDLRAILPYREPYIQIIYSILNVAVYCHVGGLLSFFSLYDIEPENYRCGVVCTAINKQIHTRKCVHTYIGEEQYVKIKVQRLAAVPYLVGVPMHHEFSLMFYIRNHRSIIKINKSKIILIRFPC